MRKIPTLFKRVYENNKVVDILPEVTEGMEWVLDGKGFATIKWDGSCCAVINGELYRRYDAKNGKPAPIDAIKCQEEADQITGHLPCWVKVDENNPADKWFVEALKNWKEEYKIETTVCGLTGEIPSDKREFLYPKIIDGTYEAIGVHFQGNPHELPNDILVRHGIHIVYVKRTFEGIKKYLQDKNIEGLVFWLDGEPKCKIKRSDFGFEWNKK